MQNRRPGFTLVELMIVIAIIGVLVAIAVPIYASLQGRARTAKAQADTRALASALTQYAAHCGALPGQAGDTCTPGGAPLQAVAVVQTNGQGQPIGPLFNAQPQPPAGWTYAVNIPGPSGVPGTFQVVATPNNGDNGGQPVTSP